MRIVYLSTARIPETWAHVLQIMKTCDAFAREGATVELVVPNRYRVVEGDPFELLGMEPRFTIRKLPCIDLMAYKIPFSYQLMVATFYISLTFYLKRVPSDTVLYARGELIVPLARSFGERFALFWESHALPPHFGRYQSILPRLAGIITVTQYYRAELVQTYGVPEGKVTCAPDAVDLEEFEQVEDKETAHKKLGLPLNRTIVVYTGSDVPWKGLGVLREAALLLPPACLVTFVGEIAPDAEDSRKYYAGLRSRTEIPLWLSAADVLVLTGTAHSDMSVRYTSPLKLFEYLAAGRPIIASDLPSFREILDEQVAYFARPDDAKDLARAIQEAVEDSGRAEKARLARARAQDYSWSARGQRITAFIQERLNREVRSL